MTTNSSEENKKNPPVHAVDYFCAFNEFGFVDVNESVNSFKNFLNSEIEAIDKVFFLVKEICSQIFSKNKTSFITVKDLTYNVRVELDRQNIHLDDVSVTRHISALEDIQFIAIVKGRNRGVQLIDNAVNIIANSHIKEFRNHEVISSDFFENLRFKIKNNIEIS